MIHISILSYSLNSVRKRLKQFLENLLELVQFIAQLGERLLRGIGILSAFLSGAEIGFFHSVSLELSKYTAEIYHIPGKENEISDILSRNHVNLKDIIDREKGRHYLTEEQTEQILRRLCIPEGRHFTTEEVKWLLEADSIENPIQPKRKKAPSKAKIGPRQIKNTPKMLSTRKVKLPRTSLHRTEGVISRGQKYCSGKF